MRLILVRHAEAEAMSASLQDADRVLTKKGINDFTAQVQGLWALIPKKARVRIYASGKKRAVQTAELFANASKSLRVRTEESLENGNFTAFLQNIGPIGENDVVVAFGHEPHVSDWCAKLCGMGHPFKKGAAAAIKIDPSSVGRSMLLWFLQPKALRKISKLQSR